MSLHPEVIEHLRRLEESGTPRSSQSTLEVARARMPLMARLIGPGPELYRRADMGIPVDAGESIRARIYDPSPSPESVLVWFHGGGWVLGDIDNCDAACATMAKQAGIRVVSVNYRLAPEHRFPTAVDDCTAALRWVHQYLLPIGGELMVGGDSAGGNLATVVARRSRDAGGPDLVLQVLVYPVTDCDFERSSYLAHGTQFPLGRNDMLWFWDHYLPDPGRRPDPDASPLKAEDLSGMPPARFVLAEYDVLADEGRAYAQKLADADVEVTVDEWDGMIHGFFSMVGYYALADAAIGRVAEHLRDAANTTAVTLPSCAPNSPKLPPAGPALSAEAAIVPARPPRV